MQKSKDIDIVFVIVPCWGVTTPPLTIASLSSYVKQYNFNSRCIDINAELFSIASGEFEDSWNLDKGYDNWYKDSYVIRFFEHYKAYIINYIYKILELNPKVVSFSTFATNIKLSLIIAKMIKTFNPGIKIIFGGPQVARYLDSEKLIYNYDFIDGLFFGEGEDSIVEYLTRLKQKNAEILTISGAMLRNNDNHISDGGMGRQLIDLKSIPFPDYSDFNLSLYLDQYGLPIASSRGCLNNCFYCTEHEFMPKYRFRLAKDIFNEMKANMKQYPHVNFFHFHDSVSNGNINELEKLCDYIIKDNISVKFSLENVILRKEMNFNICKKLKKAGCELMGYGMETCVSRLWGIIGKNVAYKQKVSADEVVRNTAKGGIKVGINVMFGIPGETEKDFNAQLDFIKKNKKYIYLVNPALVFCMFPKGCKVYRDPEKYGVDLSKGPLYWESIDGTNNYLIRLNRFTRYVEYAKKQKLNNLFGDNLLKNISELEGKYFFMNGQFDIAKEKFNDYILNNEDIYSEKESDIRKLIEYCEQKKYDEIEVKRLLGEFLISGNVIDQKILTHVNQIFGIEYEFLNINISDYLKFLYDEMSTKPSTFLQLPPQVRFPGLETFLNKVFKYVFKNYLHEQKKFNNISLHILDLMLTQQRIMMTKSQETLKSSEK